MKRWIVDLMKVPLVFALVIIAGLALALGKLLRGTGLLLLGAFIIVASPLFALLLTLIALRSVVRGEGLDGFWATASEDVEDLHRRREVHEARESILRALRILGSHPAESLRGDSEDVDDLDEDEPEDADFILDPDVDATPVAPRRTKRSGRRRRRR